MTTTKIAAPAVMKDAVMRVRPELRRAAMKMAETTFFAFLEKLNSFGDFSGNLNVELAAEAAAAEVSYNFA